MRDRRGDDAACCAGDAPAPAAAARADRPDAMTESRPVLGTPPLAAPGGGAPDRDGTDSDGRRALPGGTSKTSCCGGGGGGAVDGCAWPGDDAGDVSTCALAGSAAATAGSSCRAACSYAACADRCSAVHRALKRRLSAWRAEVCACRASSACDGGGGGGGGAASTGAALSRSTSCVNAVTSLSRCVSVEPHSSSREAHCRRSPSRSSCSRVSTSSRPVARRSASSFPCCAAASFACRDTISASKYPCCCSSFACNDATSSRCAMRIREPPGVTTGTPAGVA